MFSKLRKGFIISGTVCIFILFCLSSETYWFHPFTKARSSYGPIEVTIEQRFYKTNNKAALFDVPLNMNESAENRIYENLPTKKLYPNFDNLEVFLLFLGYPRSGSTLIGSLVDAHPNMAIANEFNIAKKILNYTERQKTRAYICEQLWKNSVKESTKEQRAETKKYFFHYHVPGLWQGRCDRSLKVIGDKKSLATSRLLSNKKLTVYDDLVSALNLPIKFIHLIRNPFDNIATMALRASRQGLRIKAERTPGFKFDDVSILEKQKNVYVQLLDRIAELRKKHSGNVLDIYYSDFLKRPAYHLRRICKFVGVECTDHYINSCVGIIFKKETYTRRYITWHEHVKKDILDAIERTDFLKDYTFGIS